MKLGHSIICSPCLLGKKLDFTVECNVKEAISNCLSLLKMCLQICNCQIPSHMEKLVENVYTQRTLDKSVCKFVIVGLRLIMIIRRSSLLLRDGVCSTRFPCCHVRVRHIFARLAEALGNKYFFRHCPPYCSFTHPHKGIIIK